MDHAIGNIQLMYQFFCQGMEVNIYVPQPPVSSGRA